ncbi:MAG TPA: YdcF family protein [Candidatus Sulfotelmatobacter sp.]|nr:YdcF family protein [Candidatus Sulfotelmatobacter sp.]
MSCRRRDAGRIHQRLIILLAGFLLLVWLGSLAFRHLGRWLVREDPLAHADVILVLSGGMPQRAEEAAEVFREGYAPEVWVSRPEGPQAELRALGVQFLGEEEYDRLILIRLGVPESAIHIFPDPAIDTEQEIQEVAREMRRNRKSSVIIVTSPEHTRRVRALWNRLAGADVKLVVRAAREDPFDADHWWRNTRDAYAVVREMLGLLNVWAGLPVRPHSS